MKFLKGNYRVIVVFGIPLFVVAVIIFTSKYNPFNDISNKDKKTQQVAFINPKKEFARNEKPEFTLAFPSKSGEVGKKVKNNWNEKNEKILISLFNKFTGREIPAYIQKQSNGRFKVVVADSKETKYGLYTIKVDATTDFKFERNLSQDFAWGVLSVNTNKSMYLPNEKAKLGYGVLDERGNTLCNADLTVEISNPDKKIQKFNTATGGIVKSPKCIGNTYSLDDDYFSFYRTGKEGRYYINLTAHTKNGEFTISDYFEVKNSLPFEVERTQFPTRIYPVEAYPVKLTVKANQDYKGQVYDLVPIDFQITNISGNGTVSRTKNSRLSQEELIAALKDEAAHLGEKNYQIKYKPSDIPTRVDKTPVKVQWDVDWKKGQTYTLTYSIYFPQVSPEYYLLGPFTVGSFKEVRDWQVASDATNCWTGSGANTNWNTSGNWGSGTPISTSNATFHGASCTTGTPDKNVTVNVNPSLTGVGGGITINSNYAGTMTQSSGVTMDITGSIGFVMAGGTFTGSDSSINTTIFNHTGGSFTSTTGTLSFLGNFTNSGGTFTHNSGTVYLSDGGAATYTFTGSTTLYNFSLNGAANNGVTLAIASGTTITVNNTLTLSSSNSCGPLLGINGPGGISAKGDITLVNNGANGSATITLNGTGSQTIAGDGSAPVFNGCSSSHINQLPNINISKSSGTTTIQNYVVASNWTYTSGSVVTTGSTLIFAAGGGTTSTLTGSMEFNNVKFYSQCNSGGTIAISSGTNIVIKGTLTLMSDTGCVGGVNGPGTIEAQENITSTGDAMGGNVPITFSGPNDQTINLVNSTFPSGNVTINKSAGSVVAASNLPFNNTGQTLTITSGVLNLGSKNLTVNGLLTINGQLIQTTGSLSTGGVNVGSKGVWENNSTGSITLGGNVSNSGYIHLDGGGPTCGDANSTSVVTSNNATFVQVKSASTGGASSLGATFNSNNTSGSLIIATVSWGAGATSVTVDDTNGNSYASALGPTTGSFGKEQTFYAYNVAAGANSVTAHFTPAATGYGLLYITEYSGIVSASDPKDTQAGNSGTGTTMNSGSSSTSNAYDLIYGAGFSANAATGAGSGFTSRNTDFGNQTEDKKVSTTGSYNATVGNDGSGWIMHMVAFKATTSSSVASAPLTIASSSPGTSRSWSGSGTYVLNDLDVTDQTGALTAYNSKNTSSSWTFTSGCPAYSNRTNVKVTGGTKITGGSKLRSN